MKMPYFQIFRLWFFLVAAIAGTLLLRGYATHPGMILGWVSLFAGGILLYEILQGPLVSRVAGIILVAIIELAAIIVVNVGNDPMEIWFGVLYGILATLLIAVRLFKKLRDLR